MHDLFHIVGLSRSAPPVEVRRVCARVVRRVHPDFVYPDESRTTGAPFVSTPEFGTQAVRRDVAVDFLEMNALLDRVQVAFFHHPSPVFPSER